MLVKEKINHMIQNYDSLEVLNFYNNLLSALDIIFRVTKIWRGCG